MKKTTLLKIMFLSVIVMLANFSAFAEMYSHTFSEKAFSAYGTADLSSVGWTAIATGGDFFAYDKTKGQQFGSSSSPASILSLKTSGISGTISSVKISTSGASSVIAKVSVSVGGTDFECAGAVASTITASNLSYEFTGVASGEILIKWDNTSSKALYVKSIEVVYSSEVVPVVLVSEESISLQSVVGVNVLSEPVVVKSFNLKGDISYVISGDDASSFSVKDVSWDASTGGSLNVEIFPNRPGIYNAFLTFSSEGAEDKQITITGTANLATPVAALNAELINHDSFTAEWGAVSGADTYEVEVYTKTANFQELAVNGDFETGNLTDWGAGNSLGTFKISTTSAHSGDNLVVNSGTTTSKLEQTIDVIEGSTYVFSFWYNNYDAKNSNGLRNYSLINASGGSGASGANYVDGGTPVKLSAATEWIKYEKTFVATASKMAISIRSYQKCEIDDVSLLFQDFVKNPIAGSPFTVAETSKEITGLTPETEYFYTVKAKATVGETVYESLLSNEISVATAVDPGKGTGIDVIAGSGIYVSNRQVCFDALAGESVEVYNSFGQRLYKGVSIEGLNTVSVDAGIVLVKVGGKTAKLIVK